ncbi:MAG: hypothetical protein O6951_05040 [Actinobacteria bacterium]|nr:hypothetical protein [Actinomycetota bacterium]
MAGLRAKTEHLRHPREISLLVSGAVLVVALLTALTVFLSTTFSPIGTGALAVAMVSLYAARGLINAAKRANSVEITSEQFPEVHRRIVQYATLFGLEETPRASMAQAGGTLNAFASKHNRINFIRINAEIVEVGESDLVRGLPIQRPSISSSPTNSGTSQPGTPPTGIPSSPSTTTAGPGAFFDHPYR